jgi:hypothetical protein
MRPTLDKAWRDLTTENLRTVPATMGVYQIADTDGTVLDIDYAGGRTTFGLRGVLRDHLDAADQPLMFRLEINMNYRSRFEELVMIHHAVHGELPPGLLARGVPLPGRLHPATVTPSTTPKGSA